MDFSKIFNVFSRTPEATTKSHEVPDTTRNRIVLALMNVLGQAYAGMGSDMREPFWEAMHGMLLLRHGTLQLDGARSRSRLEDAVNYVLQCPGDHFLDFLEYIFRVDCFWQLNVDPNQLVAALNDLLRVDDLPYHLTRWVQQTVKKPAYGYPFQGRVMDTTEVVSYPTVVMRESEVLHVHAVAPALELLENPAFVNANKEFLAALEDYRKGDFDDVLVKCGSAFESVMKVICHTKGWPYKDTDTAATLIKTLLANAKLESYFESLLMIIATLRNRLSSAHGAGASPKAVPAHIAKYAINATASAMILLTDQAGL